MSLVSTVVVAAGNAEPNPLLPDTAEMVVGIFAFLVVLVALGKFLLPRIEKQLAERTDQIEGGLKRAEEAQAEANKQLDQYKAALSEARHEAARLREEAKEQGAQIVAEMREQAQAEARRIVDAAQSQIQAERQTALAQLRAEVGALSVELASKIVGESLEDETARRGTVDRFLAELEQRVQA